MKNLIIIVCFISAMTTFTSCSENKSSDITKENNSQVSDSAFVRGEECDLTISGLHFTKSINGAASAVEVQADGKVLFVAKEKTDYFSDPNGKLSNTTAPILLTSVDNTKPFTLTAKVTPGFNGNDMYNAGVLYVYVNDNFFQKHCFEQDERGNHRIVTVQTVGTSDDSNHDIVEQPYAYMKISSDTHTIASYYSLDNENWQMVRLYENDYPSKIWLGISSQCPKGNGNETIFEEISLTEKSVYDFRLGI